MAFNSLHNGAEVCQNKVNIAILLMILNFWHNTDFTIIWIILAIWDHGTNLAVHNANWWACIHPIPNLLPSNIDNSYWSWSKMLSHMLDFVHYQESKYDAYTQYYVMGLKKCFTFSSSLLSPRKSWFCIAIILSSHTPLSPPNTLPSPLLEESISLSSQFSSFVYGGLLSAMIEDSELQLFLSHLL